MSDTFAMHPTLSEENSEQLLEQVLAVHVIPASLHYPWVTYKHSTVLSEACPTLLPSTHRAGTRTRPLVSYNPNNPLQPQLPPASGRNAPAVPQGGYAATAAFRCALCFNLQTNFWWACAACALAQPVLGALLACLLHSGMFDSGAKGVVLTFRLHGYEPASDY